MYVFKAFTRIFTVIGILFTLAVLVGVGFGLYALNSVPKEPDSVILSLNFDRPIVEQDEPSPLDLALNSEEALSLFDILHAIDKARLDPHVKGIIAHFGASQPSLSQSQEIRDAIARFRESGKFTYAFGASYGSFGLSNRSYYLASAFENIWLQPVGAVSLTGLEIQSPFVKSALDKIGVSSDFLQREEYKSVMEMFNRDGYSVPVRTMMQALLDNLSDQITSGISTSRKWESSHVKNLMEQGPYVDDEALKLGLVTRIGYRDELDDELMQKAGQDTKQVGISDYLDFENNKSNDVSHATHIALIYGTGMITDSDMGASNLSGEHIMSASAIANAFKDAANDKNIKAILFRVDSPGGSPEASETIRRALVYAKTKGKVVIVTMGSVAASGGYWVAMNADKIIAEPGTLTGSIGVVGGKFIVGDLAQKLGITFDTLKTSDNAGMWSMMDKFSPAQRDRVNALLDQTYHAFVFNVAEARKIPLEKMPDIAKGRVWTGDQAIKIGLIDELGGYDVALGSVRKALNLTADDNLSLEQFPVQPTSLEKLMRIMKGFGVESSMASEALSEWHGMHLVLAPLLENIGAFNHPDSARVSPLYSEIVR